MLYKSTTNRRDILVVGDEEETLKYCADHFVKCACENIEDHGKFFVALLGGSTSKKIFSKLPNTVPWNDLFLFWSDERSVSPEDEASNYNMAMKYFKVPKSQVFRMKAEDDIEKNSKKYEKTIKDQLKDNPFDLIMLGMGEDGHIASLFPKTEALAETKRFVVANYIDKKKTLRMTMTYPCLNSARKVVIYVFGSRKKEIVYEALLNDPEDKLPANRIGSINNKVLWILDRESSEKYLNVITDKR